MTAQPLSFARSVTVADKIRVLIVDDSLVIRHLIREALGNDPAIEIVGTEKDGVGALARIPELKPDVITLDIEMPNMDGLETLRHIRKRHPKIRTIMFSTLTQRGAAITFEALGLGADDYVAKAANAGSLDKSLASLRGELIPKIKQFFTLRSAPRPVAVAPPPPARPFSNIPKPDLVAIGVSTGGPNALSQVIPKLPAGFRIPVVIVQHMPAMFTKLLAERLDSESPLKVEEALDGMPVKPGVAILARGDHHLRLERTHSGVVARLNQDPPENSCRPSVDVLFRSAAEVYGARTLALMLTGMGYDGLEGTRALKRAGATSLVQDEATSVVWGMPGAVVAAGLADRIAPLHQIAEEVLRISQEL